SRRCRRLGAAAQWPVPAAAHAPGPPEDGRTEPFHARRPMPPRVPRSMSSWLASLCQPALAPTVELGVAETLALAARHAQVKLLDVFVLGQLPGFAVHHDPPVLQDVAVIGVAQGNIRILLGQ